MKQTVIIFSHYVKIRKKGGRLIINTNKIKNTLPVSNIDGILIYGKVFLTSDAISLCVSKKIPIILLNKYGKIKALIIPPDTSEFMNKRLKQTGLYFLKRFDIAKYIIKRKISEIENMFDINLEHFKLEVERANDYASLLGIEGLTSRLMFKNFAEMLKDTDFEFEERSYHPPKDEVNALLSFVYSLGYNLAIALILLKGFDPYISFLHTKKGSHAAFASDLLEIIRPNLTFFTLDLLLNKEIVKNDFNKDGSSIFIKKSSIYKILEKFNTLKDELIDLMKEFLIDIEKFNF
ncbi:MAG: CRISPR-associated endonuclease Cas1 [candidate division WOR-3 bacterium]